MRKMLVSILAVAALTGVAMADSLTAMFAVTNSVAMTNTLEVSGFIDKIEVSSPNVTAGTYSVRVATVDANNGAIDTYATASGLTNVATVFRTRIQGTTSAGAVINGGSSSNTNLCMNYERPLGGGQTQILVTPASCTAGGTVIVQVYFLRQSSPLVP